MQEINRERAADGTLSITYYDEQTDSLSIEKRQDVEPILDGNKRAFNDAPETGRWSEEMVEVADIPNVIVEQWMREGFNMFDPSPETRKELRRRLNSPEWRYLRTTPGRI